MIPNRTNWNLIDFSVRIVLSNLCELLELVPLAVFWALIRVHNMTSGAFDIQAVASLGHTVFHYLVTQCISKINGLKKRFRGHFSTSRFKRRVTSVIISVNVSICGVD